MAFTQAHLDELDSAIVKGKREISWNGRRVVYQSAEEMMKIRNLIASELDRADSRSNRKGILIRPKRGL